MMLALATVLPSTGSVAMDVMAVLGTLGLTLAGGLKLFGAFLGSMAKAQETAGIRVGNMMEARLNTFDAQRTEDRADAVEQRKLYRDELSEMRTAFREESAADRAVFTAAVERLVVVTESTHGEVAGALKELTAESVELRKSLHRGEACWQAPPARHNGPGLRGMPDDPPEPPTPAPDRPDPFPNS